MASSAWRPLGVLRMTTSGSEPDSRASRARNPGAPVRAYFALEISHGICRMAKFNSSVVWISKSRFADSD